MALTSEMSIAARIALLEEALAVVLDRGPQMNVEACEPPGELAVWVIDRPFDDSRVAFPLYQIARELEVLLS